MQDSGKHITGRWGAVRDAAHSTVTSFITRPKEIMAMLAHRLRNLPQVNFDLGCRFADRQLYRDALIRFKVTLWLAPGFVEAWHNLGVCYVQMGNKPKAAQAFRKTLALRPGHEEALYLLATLGAEFLAPERHPPTMPLAMVTRFFTAVAPFYQEMETKNRYGAPQILEQKLLPLLPAASGLHVADLGAGIGLVALPWRAKSAQMIALDVTQAMLAEAASMKVGEAPLFNTLLEANLLTPEHIAIPAASLDLALFVNVAQFIGDLRIPLTAIAGWLKPGGVLAMTVDPFSGEGFGINQKTSQFRHSAQYLKKIADAAGLEVLLQERVQIYPETAAGLTIYRKG